MNQTIQVDMFEVQLGAALLLQFRIDSGQVVRILADAGVVKPLAILLITSTASCLIMSVSQVGYGLISVIRNLNLT